MKRICYLLVFDLITIALVSACGSEGMESPYAPQAGAGTGVPAAGTGTPNAGSAAAPETIGGTGGVSGGGAGGVSGGGADGLPEGGAAGGVEAGAGGGSLAGDAAVPDTGASGTDAAQPDATVPFTGRFPAVDVWTDGPYTARTVTGSGPGNAYTLFRPEELAPGGVPNPIITWGNGAATNPALYPALPHLASHGFVVIAADTPFVNGEILRSGIDWLLEQNQDPASQFYQKLDPDNVASMGYSLGSLSTFEIADDPRLTTTVHISGGTMAAQAHTVANLRAPAAFLCDELETKPNCDTDFTAAQVPVFYGIFLRAGHVQTMANPWAELWEGAATGWLRWRLMADESQKALFVGPDCGLCTDTENWVVQQKDLQ